MGNPDFALVDEAYPYIAKRLLTDDSPRLRAALKYMVYGRCVGGGGGVVERCVGEGCGCREVWWRGVLGKGVVVERCGGEGCWRGVLGMGVLLSVEGLALEEECEQMRRFVTTY